MCILTGEEVQECEIKIFVSKFENKNRQITVIENDINPAYETFMILPFPSGEVQIHEVKESFFQKLESNFSYTGVFEKHESENYNENKINNTENIFISNSVSDLNKKFKFRIGASMNYLLDDRYKGYNFLVWKLSNNKNILAYSHPMHENFFIPTMNFKNGSCNTTDWDVPKWNHTIYVSNGKTDIEFAGNKNIHVPGINKRKGHHYFLRDEFEINLERGKLTKMVVNDIYTFNHDLVIPHVREYGGLFGGCNNEKCKGGLFGDCNNEKHKKNLFGGCNNEKYKGGLFGTLKNENTFYSR